MKRYGFLLIAGLAVYVILTRKKMSVIHRLDDQGELTKAWYHDGYGYYLFGIPLYVPAGIKPKPGIEIKEMIFDPERALAKAASNE